MNLSGFEVASNYSWILIIYIIILWIVLYHWNKRKFYSVASLRKGPPTLPLFGNAFYLIGAKADLLEGFKRLFEKYETPFPIWMGPKLFFLLSHPEDLEIFLKSSQTLKKDYLHKYFEPLVGHGIFTAPVLQWKKNRKIVMSTFKQKVLDSFVDEFSHQSNILTEVMKKESGKGNFDVFTYIGRYTLDTLCQNVMGTSCNAQTVESEFAKLTTRIMEIGCQRLYSPLFWFDIFFYRSKLGKEFSKLQCKLHDFTSNLVTQKIQEQQSNVHEEYHDQQPKTSLLHELVELSFTTKEMNEMQLRDEVLTLLVAGTETTGGVISYTLMSLAIYEDVQEKAFQELIDVVGSEGRQIQVVDLSKLQYLEMVINESMRLFPVVPLITRVATADIQLKKCTIPKGCTTGVAILHTHRDPNIWPNPSRFDPLRFSPEQNSKRHAYSFVPFYGGSRNCIGLKYAMISMKIVIASVLRKFKLTSRYQCIDDIKLKADLILRPADGYLIMINERG